MHMCWIAVEHTQRAASAASERYEQVALNVGGVGTDGEGKSGAARRVKLQRNGVSLLLFLYPSHAGTRRVHTLMAASLSSLGPPHAGPGSTAPNIGFTVAATHNRRGVINKEPLSGNTLCHKVRERY